ncbi:hypothetical protein ACTVLY_20650 [Serratia marcescens]|uniref:hypothetical protein n=1 Tax=Serratia marcescens TaxID=615 RepID=UPI003FA769FC
MKWTNRVIIGLVILLLTLAALLLISTLYYSTDKKMELGSLTDWISAGANICMALVAFGGYRIAKDYFSDMVKKDGYEITKKINLELLPQLEKTLNLSVINILDTDIKNYVSGKNGVFQNENEESNLKETLSQDLDNLKYKLKENRKITREVEGLIDSLEAYGWSMLPEKKQEYDNFASINKVLFSKISNIANVLSEILSRTPPEFYPIDNDPLIKDFNPLSKNSPYAAMDIHLLCEIIIRNKNYLYGSSDVLEETPYDKSISTFKKYFRNGKYLKNYFEYSPKK